MKRAILTIFVAATAAIAAVAPQPLDAQQSQPGSTSAPYLPVLADIMSGTQLRHLKLAYSGKVKNWQLADYELGQIEQSFADAARLYPVFKTFPLPSSSRTRAGLPLRICAKRSTPRTSTISPRHSGS